MQKLQGQVRWVDHPAMVADVLTKVKGNIEPLERLLSEGAFCIKAEEQQMKSRETARQDGQTAAHMRRFDVKESFGSCEISMNCESTD